MKKYQQEVEKKLKTVSKNQPKNIDIFNRYYNSQYTYLANTPMPVQRQIARKGYSFSHLPEEEQYPIWTYIWNNSEYFDVLTQALYFVQEHKKELTKEDWSVLKGWVTRLDNWVHGDNLCSLYGKLIESNQKEMLKTYQTWNKAKHPWKRRCSLVGLYYYSAQRKKPVPFSRAKPLVHNLLYDDEYYVQKGVGWTIREMYNVYPKKTYEYLCQIAEVLSPHAWQAATEKLSKKDKEQLKKIRKKSR